MKPEGKPQELTDLILDARDAAEERLTLIYKSIFTGKPMGKAGSRRNNEAEASGEFVSARDESTGRNLA